MIINNAFFTSYVPNQICTRTHTLFIFTITYRIMIITKKTIKKGFIFCNMQQLKYLCIRKNEILGLFRFDRDTHQYKTKTEIVSLVNGGPHKSLRGLSCIAGGLQRRRALKSYKLGVSSHHRATPFLFNSRHIRYKINPLYILCSIHRWKLNRKYYG